MSRRESRSSPIPARSRRVTGRMPLSLRSISTRFSHVDCIRSISNGAIFKVPPGNRIRRRPVHRRILLPGGTLKIGPFEMERMQSTWENLVEMDLSESGIRPVTLRDLAGMGLDLDSLLDMPLGYSQSNGTIALREELARGYPGASADHIEVTNGTSEANYLLSLALLHPGDEVAFEVPNYMQLGGVPESLGATVKPFRLRIDQDWEPDWEEFERAVTPKTRLVYLSHPNNPTGSVLTPEAMRRIVRRCEQAGAWRLADEVYLGAEIARERTPSFWGMSDRV